MHYSLFLFSAFLVVVHAEWHCENGECGRCQGRTCTSPTYSSVTACTPNCPPMGTRWYCSALLTSCATCSGRRCPTQTFPTKTSCSTSCFRTKRYHCASRRCEICQGSECNLRSYSNKSRCERRCGPSTNENTYRCKHEQQCRLCRGGSQCPGTVYATRQLCEQQC